MAGVDSYTKLMLHMNSTPFTDSASSPHTITNNGVTLDTTNKKFGAGAGHFNGSSDLSLLDSSDWDFGTNPFTIDFWARPNSSKNYGDYGGQGYNSSFHLYMHQPYGATLEFPGGSVSTPTNSVTAGSWHHICFVRVDTGTNHTYVYVDGVLKATGTCSYNFNSSSNKLYIGKDPDQNLPFLGEIDEFRLSNGIARINDSSDPLYISSGTPSDGFTPPTSEYSLPPTNDVLSHIRARSTFPIDRVPPHALVW